MKRTNRFILDLREAGKTQLARVGGKAANLGELKTLHGVNVPDGFCIVADAYGEIVSNEAALRPLFDRLDQQSSDRRRIGEICATIRAIIEGIPIPRALEDEISGHLAGFDKGTAFAVRSSATVEDLPAASAAGQQDSYLNIIGQRAILQHISKCWASLFTERAVSYRMQHGFRSRQVRLAVIVQEMIDPEVAGVMFTCDPISGNRKIVSIDAARGLGDALVSGRVNPDHYNVRAGHPVERKTGAHTLTDDEVLGLAALGRTIEKHFHHPQDIEWGLAAGKSWVLQSRPVTTLFPVPEAHDNENHVYVSVGHQQMMTDAMRPLGLSFFQAITGAPMRHAGGRLFVDVTPMLATAAGREAILNVLGKSDPLFKSALASLVARGDFIKPLPDTAPVEGRTTGDKDKPTPPRNYQALDEYDPAIVSELIHSSEASIDALRQDIRTKSGPDLIEFVIEDLRRLKKQIADPRSFGVIMTGMNAQSWMNEKMQEWLNERSVADTLAQSLPNNITAEMGLALLDVADEIRPFPTVIELLRHEKAHSFWDGFTRVAGGAAAQRAISTFLEKYGARCAGEIDITRPRWSEDPAAIVPMLLSNCRNFAAGESKRRFERGLRESLQKESELIARLKQLPDGEQKAAEAGRIITLIRRYSGYREYPKYHIVRSFLLYKQALLQEAERLVRAKIIREKEDIYYLALEELREVIVTGAADQPLIDNRKQEFMAYEKLKPPRVLTSDGEIVTGQYDKNNLPPGALAGLPVSSGIVEGRARVIGKIEDADPEEGDILVTRFTDPSWTPLFVSVKGLVTEVGGRMAHGAVIAREYGLPAVVGVENATQLIRDGQRIRVDGTEGYIELLEP
ncbi:MAG TPA: phosphoenolpyruvate synthase [Puia sp.]|nr:phosphoenolpyruvate synthase [Puia sp.]